MNKISLGRITSEEHKKIVTDNRGYQWNLKMYRNPPFVLEFEKDGKLRNLSN